MGGVELKSQCVFPLLFLLAVVTTRFGESNASMTDLTIEEWRSRAQPYRLQGINMLKYRDNQIHGTYFNSAVFAKCTKSLVQSPVATNGEV